MFRRILVLGAICAALVAGSALPAQAESPATLAGGTTLSVPPGDSTFELGSADTTPATGASITSSPKCSGTGTYGVIRYQVCFRYNCDSTSCNTRGYLGISNGATTSRTVTWVLSYSVSYTSGRFADDSGTYSLAGNDQQTIYSQYGFHHYYCGFRHNEILSIKYGSADWSPELVASEHLSCV